MCVTYEILAILSHSFNLSVATLYICCGICAGLFIYLSIALHFVRIPFRIVTTHMKQFKKSCANATASGIPSFRFNAAFNESVHRNDAPY